MRLVLDNNSFFSIMSPQSVSSYLFASMRVEFIAPKFINEELNKYKEECLFKSKLSEHEFEIRKKEICESIILFDESEYDTLLTKAIRILPDPKDSPYLALALLTKASIWSNDPHLRRQTLVRVFTTLDLVTLFLEGLV